jgi:hypothetical protein
MNPYVVHSVHYDIGKGEGKLTLEHAIEAQRGSIGTAPLFI